MVDESWSKTKKKKKEQKVPNQKAVHKKECCSVSLGVGGKQLNYRVEFHRKKPKEYSQAFSFLQRSLDSNLQLQFPLSRFRDALLSGSDELPVGAEIRTA